MRKSFLSIASALLAFACIAAASAQLPPDTFSPVPSGTVVHAESVLFNGSSADRWEAVVSKKVVGSGNGQTFYQWFLSFYQLRSGAYRLRYESPYNGGPLSRVTQANGAKMWFPVQEIKIVGAAPLAQKGVQLLVVQSREMAADCGSAAVTVFGTRAGGAVGPLATISNPCDLAARIGSDGTSLVLTGPYYAANAPLCCPTKANATTVLRYVDGKWTQSPSYFKVE